MVANFKFNDPFHPLRHGLSIMEFKKDRPGFPLFLHHEYWPTSCNEEKERQDWQKEICTAAEVISIQDDSVTKAKEEIAEEIRLKEKKEYQAMRKKQAIEAKQQKQQQPKNNSLLKKLSEKK